MFSTALGQFEYEPKIFYQLQTARGLRIISPFVAQDVSWKLRMDKQRMRLQGEVWRNVWSMISNQIDSDIPAVQEEANG